MSVKRKQIPDTNVIIRYLISDLPSQYAEAELFFEEVRNGREQAIILESVLIECLYILDKFYKVPRVKAAESLAGLLRYKGISANDIDSLLAALKLYAESSLDPVDSLLAAYAQRDGIEVFTFDKKLKKEIGSV